MAYGACANDMRSSRDALAKSRFPGVGKGLIKWAGGCTRMMIKLQDLYCYFLQAFAVRYSGWHDCRK